VKSLWDLRKKTGRKPKLRPREITWARARWRGAMPQRELCSVLGICKATLLDYAQKHDFGPHPNGVRQKGPQQNHKRDNPTPKVWMCQDCGGRCYEGPVHASHGEEAA
jgi:hypothetical protein